MRISASFTKSDPTILQGSSLFLAMLAMLLLTACEPSATSQMLDPQPAQAPRPEASEDQVPGAAPLVDAENEQGLSVGPTAQDPEINQVPYADGVQPTLELLGQTVEPGTSRRLMWSGSQVFEGISSETPVLVVNGVDAGPTLCLTAAIHGDELNGIEIVRRIIHDLDPEKLKGAVIGIPIVNLQGFRRGSRYLPDRRDLNRFFPGNPEGSSAARIAYSLFHNVIAHCSALVDLHTGSFHRNNLPQLRADLRHSNVAELTRGFGSIVVLHSVAADGTLRRAATEAGIPALTLEAGEPLRLQSGQVDQGVTGVFSLLSTLGIIKRIQLFKQPEPIFYKSIWVRADHGGILFSVARLGQVVDAGDILGTVTDPISNEQNLIYSPVDGRVLGMAVNQVVMPGFATFRIGIETDDGPLDPVPMATDKLQDPLLRYIPMDSEAAEDPEERSE